MPRLPDGDERKVCKTVRLEPAHINQLIEDFGTLSTALQELVARYLKRRKKKR